MPEIVFVLCSHLIECLVGYRLTPTCETISPRSLEPLFPFLLVSSVAAEKSIVNMIVGPLYETYFFLSLSL